jgi:hypothetical protein
VTEHSEDVMQALETRAERRADRRAFFTAVLGTAAVGAGAFAFSSAAKAQAVTDGDILNFALNLEYLEANFYHFAVFGTPIPTDDTSGTGNAGEAVGGKQVTFTDNAVRRYAEEIAADELAHVRFLRTALGDARVAQPRLDLGFGPDSAFSTAARAAGLIGAGESFDPYSTDENFLLGAFIFEDVGVTAYKGAAPLITNKEYLSAAAGIHAVEAYHAAIVRTTLYRKGIETPALIRATEAISKARDMLDGRIQRDQGIRPRPYTGDLIPEAAGTTLSNIVPLDRNGLTFSRSAGQVLNIVYLNPAAVTMGGFFPAGANGNIATSAGASAE